MGYLAQKRRRITAPIQQRTPKMDSLNACVYQPAVRTRDLIWKERDHRGAKGKTHHEAQCDLVECYRLKKGHATLS
jgi:hypothetical protein